MIEAQWRSGSTGGVELNNNNHDEPVLIYNSDSTNPLFLGGSAGGKLRVADSGASSAINNLVSFHAFDFGRATGEHLLRLNFTKFSSNAQNNPLIQGVENLTDEKFKIDIEGDAFFEGSLRLLDLGYTGSSSIAARVRGDEAIWYDGTAFSWGFGGEYNRFADPIIIGASGIPDADVQLRITNGNLQIQKQALYIDNSTDGAILFRDDNGDFTSGSINTAGPGMTMEHFQLMQFNIAGREVFNLTDGQANFIGDIDISNLGVINFHSDATFSVPRANIKLENNGALRMQNLLENNEILITTDGGDITLNNAITAGVVIKGANVGINEKNPEHTLHVEGNAAVTGEFLVLSDRNKKKNISPYLSVLSKFISLVPVQYDLIDVSADHKSIGLIAQEVEEVFPEVVHTNQNGTKMVNYRALGVLSIQAIKEQDAKIAALESQMKELMLAIEKLQSE